MKLYCRLVAILLLAGAPALAVEINSIRLEVLPADAVLVNAGPNQLPALLSDESNILLSLLLRHGPVVALMANDRLLLLPQQIGPMSFGALVYPKGASKDSPDLIRITEEQAGQIKTHLAEGRVSEVYGILGHSFENSAQIDEMKPSNAPIIADSNEPIGHKEFRVRQRAITENYLGLVGTGLGIKVPSADRAWVLDTYRRLKPLDRNDFLGAIKDIVNHKLQFLVDIAEYELGEIRMHAQRQRKEAPDFFDYEKVEEYEEEFGDSGPFLGGTHLRLPGYEAVELGGALFTRPRARQNSINLLSRDLKTKVFQKYALLATEYKPSN